MSNPVFTGAAAAVITPFTEDLKKIDYDKFDEIVEYQIAHKTDAVVVAGTTGEAPTLSVPEHIELVNHCIKTVNGRVPVIASCGSNDTFYCVGLANECEKAGADALLMVTPYYNKTSQSGVIEHYNYIADRVNTPIILYHIPGRTGMTMKPETIFELSKHKNIVGIKEASGNISSIGQTASLCSEEFCFYSGNDDQIVPVMSLGGKGVISVLSHVAPEVAHNIAQFYLDGKTCEAAALQLEYMDLCTALFCDVNPIPVKEAMNMMGFNVGRCRMPLGTLSDDNKSRLRKALKNHGLI